MRFRSFRPAAWRGVLACAGFLTLAGAPAYGQRQTADSNSGYVDSALIGDLLRFRYDSAYDDNRPERAEFFYAKGRYFHNANMIPSPSLVDPRAAGPPLVETSVNYQELSAYLELAAGERLSGFVELPERFLQPEQNAHAIGFADMNAGFKLALLSDPNQVLTFQFRTYIPTGDASRGLGTNHVSLEPALLLFQRLTDRLTFEGELRDWIPIGGTDFEGNVVRYGVSLSYLALRREKLRVAPVLEFVGWTVLGGKEEAVATPLNWTVEDAAGDTIINAKVGVRLKYGERSDLYVGYGRALTGDVWYKDILRVEYRLAF
jgi:hypothetical protein